MRPKTSLFINSDYSYDDFTYNSGADMSEETLEAFLKEGMLMKDFNHQNVLSLIGVAFADHGLPMIILPYMGNGNLKTYISNPQVMVGINIYSNKSWNSSSG